MMIWCTHFNHLKLQHLQLQHLLVELESLIETTVTSQRFETPFLEHTNHACHTPLSLITCFYPGLLDVCISCWMHSASEAIVLQVVECLHQRWRWFNLCRNNPLRSETINGSKQRFDQAKLTPFSKKRPLFGSTAFLLEAGLWKWCGCSRSCFDISSGSCSVFQNDSLNVRGWHECCAVRTHKEKCTWLMENRGTWT